MRRMMLLALFACFAAVPAQAQDTGRTRLWAAVGAGAGVPTSGGDGIANLAQIVVQTGAHHAALRALVLHDIERGTKEIGEAGVLYGRTRPLGRGRIAVAAGVSFIGFDTCPDDDDTCFALGVPLVAEATLGGRFAGVGIQAFGNVNSEASYAGAVLFVQLGRLR